MKHNYANRDKYTNKEDVGYAQKKTIKRNPRKTSHPTCEGSVINILDPTDGANISTI